MNSGLQKYSAAILHWVGHGIVQQVEHLETYIPKICYMNGAILRRFTSMGEEQSTSVFSMTRGLVSIVNLRLISVGFRLLLLTHLFK